MKSTADNDIGRLLLVVLVSLVCPALPASAGVNVWTTNGPIDNGVRVPVTALAVDPSAPATLYAGSWAADFGVFKSTDGGASWTFRSAYFLQVVALVIDPSASATLYAGTNSWDTANGVFKSTDGGVNWTDSLLNRTISVLAVDPSAADTVYAGTLFTGFVKSTDRGAHWTTLDLRLTDSFVNSLAIDPATSSTIYAGTSDYLANSGGVFKSTDGGASWTAINAGLANYAIFAFAIDPANPATLYAGTSGGVFKTTDGGARWTAASTGLTNLGIRALAMDPAASGTLYAGTAGDGVFTSTDGGASWTAMNAGLTSLFVNALAIDPSTPARIYAGTEGGVYEFLGADGPCVPDATRLCLNGGRFRVTTEWATRDGVSGPGRAVGLTGDTGYFTFFDAANVEVLVKVLNGCGLNSRYWTFAGGLTNVNVILTVTDTQTGAVKTYVNPQRTAFQPIQDTDAFATCP
jgi:photosystem II stability/assembly factor-like uncharacterized protein